MCQKARFVVLARLLGFCLLLAGIAESSLASSWSAQDASERDNKEAWENISRLKRQAYELTVLYEEFEPGYQLFANKTTCLKAMNSLRSKSLARECHKVGPRSKLSDFWSVIALENGKLYTETRFRSFSLCVEAASLTPAFKYKKLEAYCGNSETKSGPETGE